MRVQDVKEYVESILPFKYVMNMFHQTTPDNCCVVILGPSGVSDRNVKSLLFQFLVRSNDPEVAEDIAYKLHGHFNDRTDYVIGGSRIVVSRGQQAVPIYTGTDDNARHIYSVNIRVLVDN